MTYETILNRPGAYRILLETRKEGVYINIFENQASPGPYMDYLQDSLAIAQEWCKKRYSVNSEDWRDVPDEPWH